MEVEIMDVLKERGIEVTRDVLLFIYGVKPACVLSSNKRGLVHVFQSVYPNIGVQRVPKKFIDGGLKVVSREGREYFDYNHGELGKVLGYPPEACDWFSNLLRRGELKGTDKCVIDYHGMLFACAVDMVDDCLSWVKKNRPVPDEIKTEIVVKKYVDGESCILLQESGTE
ncbi:MULTISPECIES: hypothetical protein [Bacillus subtilis group]|uniref:hypothetical protein n=1 Tax=Bacillus TaxID=1386 RepID=UPI0011A9B744|nr:MULTISPECIES: hypothetical protein [Bacillus subtilis group]MBT3123378.1 hypothetical protein [Bacillus inaquosorum]MCB4341342.1 hypothetical protein [Bacillus subtilis]MCB5337147.1 hypothetical protein [Bacillus amyloliquefaciens]MCF7615474.1 hypothetical protein [Bacillus subtilis]QWK35390.1 hypothetical protein KM843_19720 [Bacillus velezensis]